jgi:hypothetical protein
LREMGDGRQIACHLVERIPEWHLL